MPRRDGTGPMGNGSQTGLGRGPCAGNTQSRQGGGYGNGRGMGFCRRTQTVDKETLQAQKECLQARLSYIEKQLEE